MYNVADFKQGYKVVPLAQVVVTVGSGTVH